MCVLVVWFVCSPPTTVSHQHAGASPSLIDEEDLGEHDDSEHGEEHNHNEEAEVRALS